MMFRPIVLALVIFAAFPLLVAFLKMPLLGFLALWSVVVRCGVLGVSSSGIGCMAGKETASPGFDAHNYSGGVADCVTMGFKA